MTNFTRWSGVSTRRIRSSIIVLRLVELGPGGLDDGDLRHHLGVVGRLDHLVEISFSLVERIPSAVRSAGKRASGRSASILVLCSGAARARA